MSGPSTPFLDAFGAERRATLIAASRRRTVAAGEQLIAEGDPVRCATVVLSGTVRVFHRSPSGVELVVMFCRGPALVGELEVVLGIDHIENVSAIDAGEVLEIPAAAFRAAIEAEQGGALALLRHGYQMLAMASHNQKALAFQDVRTRLATLLLAYSVFDGQRAPDGLVLRSRMTQDDLASALGVTRRAVGKEITRWQRERALATRGGRYVIVDASALAREAAGEHIGLTYDMTRGLLVMPASPLS